MIRNHTYPGVASSTGEIKMNMTFSTHADCLLEAQELLAAAAVVVDLGSAMALCVTPVDRAFLTPADDSWYLN